MVKQLDQEWEIERPRFIHIASEIFGVLGGWKGILAFFVGLYLFYSYILYTVASGRKRREAAKAMKKSS